MLTTKVLPPLLKYPGGKRKLVPRIAEYFERSGCDRLVELFCGSGAVSLGIKSRYALLNDINPHVINFHRTVKYYSLSPVPNSWLNEPEFYYFMRDVFNANREERSPDMATKLQYLNHTCYNGLMRFNQDGCFNVPFGKYAKVNFLRDFSPWEQTYQTFSFSCGDFEDVSIKKSDFVYADPPYDGDFTGYAGNKFDWAEQERLALFLVSLPGSVLASNAATERIRALYSGLGFQIEEIAVGRSISCNGDRTPAREFLMYRPARRI